MDTVHSMVKATTTATNPDYQRHPHYDRCFLAPRSIAITGSIAYVLYTVSFESCSVPLNEIPWF